MRHGRSNSEYNLIRSTIFMYTDTRCLMLGCMHSFRWYICCFYLVNVISNYQVYYLHLTVFLITVSWFLRLNDVVDFCKVVRHSYIASIDDGDIIISMMIKALNNANY